MTKTLSAILKDVNNGAYSNVDFFPKTTPYHEDHIFDKNQSLSWNRQQVHFKNQELKILQRAWEEEAFRLKNLLTEDINQALQSDFNFNEKEAAFAFRYALEQHPESSFSVIINFLMEFGISLNKFKKCSSTFE